MAQLTDLEGLKSPIDCVIFSRVSEIRSILKKGMAATTADTNGAINVWIDLNGFYHGSLHRHQQTIGKIMSSDFLDVRELCKKWINQIK